MSFEWTDERVELLRAGFAEGLSSSLVAVKIGDGISRNAVIGKASRLGIIKGATTHVMARGDAKRLLTPRVPIPRPERRTPFRLKPAPEPTQKPPAAPAAVVPPPPTAVSLMDIGFGHCRWIDGTPAGADTLFCGDTKAVGSYCAKHAAMAYRVPDIRRRRAS